MSAQVLATIDANIQKLIENRNHAQSQVDWFSREGRWIGSITETTAMEDQTADYVRNQQALISKLDGLIEGWRTYRRKFE